MFQPQPIVTIKNGKLGGKIAKDYDGGEYYSFQGIPYAKPPLGQLRFKAPLPAESWEGVKDATVVGSNCLSFNPLFQTMSGSIDCLYLNVYTRELSDKSKTLKPVMVYIHGGAFILGSGSTELYGPEFLITKDVVIVTINYRLGLLGFLNFEDHSLEVPGNAGFKDQILALKWVQENISQFSGDRNNVTIFGSSAGGAAVHYLMLSPLAKGLFHKCIIQSGSALCPWAKGHRTLPYLIDAMQISTTNEKEILEMLEKMSPEELIDLQKIIKDDFEPSYRRCFAPVVENVSSGAFLTEEPEQIILSGNYHHVPMIIGFTSREGIFSEFYCEDAKCGYVIKNFESKIPHSTNIEKGSELSKIVANKINNFYYDQHKPCEENKDQFYLMQGDSIFQWPAIMTVKHHSTTSTAPIYLYKFSTDGKLNIFRNFCQYQAAGAAHGDDSGYLFTTIMTPPIIPNSPEGKVMKIMVELWTNFATYGNPNSPKADSLIKINWQPVDGDTLHYLDIGENVTVGINPDEDRMRFWEEIFSLEMNKTKL